MTAKIRAALLVLAGILASFSFAALAGPGIYSQSTHSNYEFWSSHGLIKSVSPATSMTIQGNAAAASGGPAVVINSENTLTGTDKILSIQNNGSEMVSVKANNTYVFLGGNITNTGGYVSAENEFRENNAGNFLKLKGGNGDSGSAIGIVLDTWYAYVTGGAKIASFRNNGVEQAYIDKDGVFAENGTSIGASATIAGQLQANTGVIIGNGATKISSSYRTAPVIDIANITAQTCLDTATTVTGALVQAECAVGYPASPTANISLSCYVSAADTVQLRACNPTGAGINPASATYDIRVFNP